MATHTYTQPEDRTAGFRQSLLAKVRGVIYDNRELRRATQQRLMVSEIMMTIKITTMAVITAANLHEVAVSARYIS